MNRKKINHENLSTLFIALMLRISDNMKRHMVSLIFLVTAAILEFMRSLLTVFISRMADSTKRQMVSLFSLVMATMIITTPLAAAVPSMGFNKTASPAAYSNVGDKITYTYMVTNIGTENITGPITVIDNKLGTFDIANGLNVGESKTNNTDYTITQDDINRTNITNTAYAVHSGNQHTNSQIVTVPFAHLILTKTANLTNYSRSGQVIEYNYSVTNDGSVNLTGLITVTDNKTNGGLPFNITGNGLNISESKYNTTNYTITQADTNVSSVTNSAFAKGTYNGTNITSSNKTVTVPYAPLTLEKTATQTAYSAVGDKITYTYKVTNVGDNNITSPINVTDDYTGNITISPTGLNVSANTSKTANYTIQQSDIARGYVTNTAVAKSTYNGSQISSTAATATVSYAHLTLEKTASPTSYQRNGQSITYNYTVKNDGHVNLTGPITFTDNKVGTFNITNDGLAVNQTGTNTSTYNITSNNITEGSVTNSAFATGTYNGVPINSSSKSVTILYSPLNLTKTASPTVYSAVGQNITYTYKVQNDGDNNITGLITVTDDKVGTFNITGNGLNVSENTSKTVNYTIKPSDITAGSVTNSAFATGTYNGRYIMSGTTTATVEYAHLTLSKTANLTNYSLPGQVIGYNYSVTNDGNVNLAGPITVTDNKINGGTPFNITDSDLNVSETKTNTTSYTIIPDDINASSVTNSAFATGTYNNIDINSSTKTVTVPYAPLMIVKTANPTTYSAVGDKITYTYTVTNIGDRNITNPINVTDDHIIGNISISPTGLNVSANTSKTANYYINQSDIDRGYVINTAVAKSTYNGSQISSTAAAATVLYAHLKIVKTASPTTYSAAGQNVTYTYNVTNDGNVNLTGPITVRDDHINGGIPFNVTSNGLGVGANVNGTAIYKINQSDINAGSVTNNATATGTYNGIAINSNSTTATVLYGHLKIVKTASPTTYNVVGQNVTYTYNVTNDGNVTFTGPITVRDDHINGGIPFNVTSNGLGVGANTSNTSTYTIQQSDINAGSVTNNATATGTYNGVAINSNSTTATILYVYPSPHLKIVKTASPTTYSVVGQNVTYTYYVTNDGNVTFTGPITVRDDHINGGIPFNVTSNGLGVGASVNGTAIYKINQSDITAGSVTNNATATGTYNRIAINSNATTATVLYGHLKIVKTASPTTYSAVGQNVTYTYNVTNDGNVTFTGPITVRDDHINGGIPFNVASNGLGVGANVNGTAIYTINQSDITAGSVTNNATATGTYNGIAINSNVTTATVTATHGPIPSPAMTIVKSVVNPDPTGDCIINNVGDKVPYVIVVTNEGNVNLTNVTVNDTLITLPDPTGDNNNDSILNPGETWMYNATYTLTSDDVANGYVNNTATVSCDQLPAKSSSVNTTVVKNPDLQIYKSVTGIDEAGDHMINHPGDVINYQVAVKNTGNVALTGVSVDDPMITLTKTSGGHNDSGVLKPGETWVYTGDYTVTQADIDSNGNGTGLITNTATVSCNEHSIESSSVQMPIVSASNTQTDTNNGGNTSANPVAAFSANPTSGNAPLSVQFTDQSTGSPTSWSWDFGDSASSTQQSPMHIYNTPGTYTAKLTVNGGSYQTATINVLQATTTSSSGGSSGSGGGGGGSIGHANVVSSSSTVSTTATPSVTPTETSTPVPEQTVTPANVQTPEPTNTSTPAKQGAPGFEVVGGIIGLLGAVYLYRRR